MNMLMPSATPARRGPLGRRLAFALLAMLAPLVAVAGIGFATSRSSVASLHEIRSETVVEVAAIEEIGRLLTEADDLGETFFELNIASDAARFARRIEVLDQRFEELAATAEGRERSVVAHARATWRQAVNDLADAVGKPVTAFDDPLDPFHDHVDEAIGLVSKLHPLNGNQISHAIGSLRASERIQLAAAVLTLAVGLAIAALLARRVGRSITRPVAVLEDAAVRFAADEFTYRIPVIGNDELTRVSNAFNAMAAKLQFSTSALQHQALHDGLTGLPNRTMLRERLEHATARAAQDRLLALLLLDLDGFKNVNDSLGHAAGDQLLMDVAARLERCLRPGDIVARLGGDEFAVLGEGLPTADSAAAIVDRIAAAFREPFEIEGSETVIQASVGVVTSTGECPPSELLRDADLAMYEAKSSGKGTYRVYDPIMHQAVEERVTLEADLSGAVERDELTLRYQPIVNLASGEIRAVEALVRWNHPTRGLLGPDVFIPIAEETGLIVPIGAWVLSEACDQLARWHEQFPGGQPLAINVNVTARQLRSPSFKPVVQRALERAGLNPSLLTLEVTETVVMKDVEASIAALEELTELGVNIALDDFGIGSSSLGNLRRFPINIVKLDKSFVDHVPDGAIATALAAAIAEVTSALQLHSVVEGVERAEQQEGLIAAGYEYGQGYFFAKPLDVAGIDAILGQPRVAGHAVQVHGRDSVAAFTATGGRAPRVLVLEDNEALQRATARQLERAGAVPVIAGTLQSARQLLATGHFDAAVVDIELPDGNGWTLIEELRRDASGALIPIVVRTSDDIGTLGRAAALDCEYLGKPSTAAALLSRLDRARKTVAKSRRHDGNLQNASRTPAYV